MDWWQAAALGIVQGLTEFIPISSSAHLRIVPALLGWGDPGTAFSAVIQLGTLAAVFAYFAGDIVRLGIAAAVWPISRKPTLRDDARLAWAIAAGNLPIVVCGLAGKDFIETEARSLYLIGTMLIVVALGLAAAERRAAMNRTVESLGWGRIFVIGLFQALALIPGSSRSGSTILGGLLMGLKREDAARFSFLLGIPAILGSGVYQLRDLTEEMGRGSLDWVGHGSLDWVGLLAGLAAAAISGYISIGFLLKFLQTHTTGVFVIYRLVLGSAVILLAYGGIVR